MRLQFAKWLREILKSLVQALAHFLKTALSIGPQTQALLTLIGYEN
jgi:hypothetical protein